MLRVYVDFNSVEEASSLEEPHVVIIRFVGINAGIKDQLHVGQRVILWCEDVECEGIVRRGKREDWAAALVEGTMKDVT